MVRPRGKGGSRRKTRLDKRLEKVAKNHHNRVVEAMNQLDTIAGSGMLRVKRAEEMRTKRLLAQMTARTVFSKMKIKDRETRLAIRRAIRSAAEGELTKPEFWAQIEALFGNKKKAARFIGLCEKVDRDYARRANERVKELTEMD